jgi:uncharacterized RDD family membrane protein YckC
MSTIRIATNFNIDLDFEAAPFHRRFLAWVVDVLVVIFYAIILAKVFNWIQRDDFGDEGDNFLRSLFLFLLIVPPGLYHLICEILMKGQSIGKRITGIRVVNENGGRVAISQIIIRWLIRTSDFMALVILIYAPSAVERNDNEFMFQASAAMILLVLDVILVNASKKRQRLGDMLAHTILIRTRQEGTIDETIFTEVSNTYTPSFPQVMQLSDRDINALKGILDTAKRRHDYAMAEMASEKIKNHLKIQTPLSPFEFLEILLKDYNYLSAH